MRCAFSDRIKQELDSLQKQGLLRTLPSVNLRDKGRLSHKDKAHINLVGNDYLGLAADKELTRLFYQQAADNLFSFGSTGSRLLSGNDLLYKQLEDKLTKLYKRPALIFNSGYHLNTGVLPALSGKQDLILADKLCHASLIDGMRLARADLIRYPHLDYETLTRVLDKKREQYRDVFIVTESVFSMDGDVANLPLLLKIKNKYQSVLYVDDAHGVGIRGESGLGIAEEQGCMDDIDILVGTFGKAWGGMGGFVICSPMLRDYLLNRARTFIFSTAIPAINLAWLLFVAERIGAMTEKREKVAAMASKLRKELTQKGLVTGGNSCIVPVIAGDPDKAALMGQKLRKNGFWPGVIRPPTVPTGTARLRISLHAALDWQDIKEIPSLLT